MSTTRSWGATKPFGNRRPKRDNLVASARECLRPRNSLDGSRNIASSPGPQQATILLEHSEERRIALTQRLISLRGGGMKRRKVAEIPLPKKNTTASLFLSRRWTTACLFRDLTMYIVYSKEYPFRKRERVHRWLRSIAVSGASTTV